MQSFTAVFKEQNSSVLKRRADFAIHLFMLPVAFYHFFTALPRRPLKSCDEFQITENNKKTCRVYVFSFVVTVDLKESKRGYFSSRWPALMLLGRHCGVLLSVAHVTNCCLIGKTAFLFWLQIAVYNKIV